MMIRWKMAVGLSSNEPPHVTYSCIHDCEKVPKAISWYWHWYTQIFNVWYIIPTFTIEINQILGKHTIH